MALWRQRVEEASSRVNSCFSKLMVLSLRLIHHRGGFITLPLDDCPHLSSCV
jgi:hypothetical protein